MKKLIQGIIDFRQNVRPEYREKFSQLALGQSPDTLFIACSDSRVVPNLFASTDPGDLFVIRNVGNLVPPCTDNFGNSEAAAIEFALKHLPIKDIIVCGHSECGAMQAVISNTSQETNPLRDWLEHAHGAKEKLEHIGEFLSEAPKEPHNKLSQLNVLQQINHLSTYPLVREKMKEGSLKLHGWWFDLSGANVYTYDDVCRKFILVDESEAERILALTDHSGCVATSC